ncbi:YceI family protein [Sphingobium sp.]|uniref:YceI family protein n=1 Tax=Sphingobium sp. TaxID=1912891 RepID=UPI0028BEA43E|nr:YceI family protein [Sphingobium sp.]
MKIASGVLVTAAAALLGVAANSAAWTEQGAPPPKAQVRAGNYKADPHHSQAIFSVSHFGLTDFSGLFSGVTGSLKLDPASLAATKVDVALPVASVLTTSDKLNEELRGDQWLDAVKYPNATFTSTKVTPQGDGTTAVVEGTFTLHGISKPVTAIVNFSGAGDNPIAKAYTVGFRATTTIKRSDFGVKAYVPMIGDDVKLTFVGAFELQASQ